MDNPLDNKRVFPALFILAAATAIVTWYEKVPGQITHSLTWLPYALSLIIAGLALQFNRRQLLVVVAINCFSYWICSHYLQQPLNQSQPFIAYSLLCLFLPLNLWLNLSLKEQGLRHFSSWLLAALILCQALLIIYFAQYPDPDLLANLSQWFAVKPIAGIIISANALGIALFFIMLAMVYLLLRPSTIGIGLFFGLVAAIFPLVFLDKAAISSVFFSAAMIIVLISGFSDSHELAYRDQLTGLLGRRSLIEKLSPLSRNYCLAMVDIDHFKKFNDTYGHDVGDDVLAMVAARLNQVGGNGKVFRYGGEEFTVVFKGKDSAQFFELLDALRDLVASTPFAIRNQAERENSDKTARKQKNTAQQSVQVTISIGAAQKDVQHESYEDVLKAADQALYQAKEQGRNKVVMS